jgi:hypothetical protein
MLLQRLVRLLPIALSMGQDEIVTVIRSAPTNWHGVINVHLLANFDRLRTTRAQTFLAAEKAGVIRSGIMDAPNLERTYVMIDFDLWPASGSSRGVRARNLRSCAPHFGSG